jgi:pimeloyl-ACP methyl ester carboxylesterase
MLKELADAATVADWSRDIRAEYARVSPDSPAHWSIYVEKTRTMWSRPTWGISEAELGKVSLPVMLVAGDHDVTCIEETARIFRAIPKAKLYILPGTGHTTFQDRPDWMNSMILDFLDGN